MPRIWLTDNTDIDKPTVNKIGTPILVENDDSVDPTVWKLAANPEEVPTDEELPSAFRPGYECIVPSGVVISADILSGYFPLEVTFSAVVGAGSVPLTYLWDFGDGNTSSEEFPSHIYTAVGEFPVTLTVTNECGDAVSNELTVDIVGDFSNILFQDNFDGAADTVLSAHTPDVVPVGSVWEITQGNIVLNGTGEALAPLPSGDTQARIILTANINLPTVWMFELLSTPDPTINETSFFTIRNPGGQTMTLRIGDNDSYARFTDAAGVTRAISITPGLQYRFKAVILGDGTVDLYLNDVFVINYAVTSISVISQVNIYIAAELTGTSKINRLHVEALV